MSGVWDVVYWFSLPALAILTLVLLSRKLVARFPFFFSYVVAGVLIDLSRLVTYRILHVVMHVYYRVYWISDGVTSVLALLVTCELVLSQLFPSFQRVKFYRYCFSIGAIIIGSAAIFTAANNRLRMDMSVLLRTLHTIDSLRVALLLFFLLLMFFMGRQWKGHELGIALGLGVNAAALLTTLAVWTRYFSPTTVLPAIAYDTACIIWLITFLHRERPAPTSNDVSNPEIVEEAKRWEEVLRKSVAGRKLPR